MRPLLAVPLISLGLAGATFANGIDRNGVGARGMATGGASVADQDDAMASMAINPSHLGEINRPDVSVGIGAAWGSGLYRNQYGGSGKLDGEGVWFPELVLRYPGGENFGVGLSVIPENSRTASWDFTDPQGGGNGASYGRQEHEAWIKNIRAAVGVGWRISDSVNAGASVGAVYQENRLHAPYLFQSHPVLAGLKTLLDLETDGWGANGDLGITWQPREDLTFGLSYRTPTSFRTTGRARGNLGAQFRSLGGGFATVPPGYEYDAAVRTRLPQKVALGTSWQATKRLRLAGQVEWVNWSAAFDTLEVRLSNGTNRSINQFLGTDRIADDVPLDWQDRFVYRAGAEYALTKSFSLRGGYVYGRSPIPDSTLLPMSAAISEHTLTAGFGWEAEPFSIDLAWQHDFGATRHAGSSRIAGTEYDNSSVRVSADWLALTVGVSF